MNALILYTEAAPYVIACLEALASRGVRVVLVRWPVNAEAPFAFGQDSPIEAHVRSGLDDPALMGLAEELSPDIVITSGWVDKGYLRVCRAMRQRGVPTVMICDTAWRGDVRQWAHVLLSRSWLRGTFSHAWVTGGPQRHYARMLGIPGDRIRTGFYSADTGLFAPLGERLLAERATSWPHRFLCVARYIPTKGQQTLCDAFALLCDQGEAGDWELWLAGTGEQHQQVMDSPSGRHPRIRHLGFKQAAEMRDVVAESGVFVLPSLYEPWGVVVHEHACAGLPLVLSDAVGAAERFLEEGINGFRYKAGDKYGLRDALRAMVRRSDAELRDMGRRSAQLGRAWNPDAWADTAIGIVQAPRT
ncbi:MAG: glycosyltransferase family 4 protein [Flavobacteriales bacterium]|nr:glycosyltransferase family 4 protein [Flavobacteriales bacterium]